MKSKKLFALLLTGIILAGLIITGCDKDIPLSEEKTAVMEYMPEVSSDYYRNLLEDEKEKELYDNILRAVIAHDKDYDIRHFDTQTVNRVALYLSLDNPFIILSDNLLEYTRTHDYDSAVIDYLTEFDIPFSMEYEDMTREILQSIEKSEEIISAMPEYEDEYDKARYLHDYLATTVRYTYADETKIHHCTPYAALITGSGMCESYSRAYALLCNMAGIECFMVMYDQSQSSDGVGHMWNMVKINGNYYHVDVTNDSFTGQMDYPENYVAYDYFLTDEDGLTESGLISEKIRGVIPVVSEDKDSYFVKNNLLFDSYNRNTVGEAAGKYLKQQKEEGYCGVSIKFTVKSDYDRALKKSEFQKLLYVISQHDGYGADIYDYGTNDRQFIIRIHPRTK